jgi:hypothetical protein
MNLIHRHDTDTELKLTPHSFYHLKHVEPGTTVVCEQGLLLMTQSGDLRDYTIKSGERVVLEEGKHVLIEAMSPSNFCILYPN